MIDDAAGVEALDDRLGPQGALHVVRMAHSLRRSWMPSIMSGFMSSL